MSIRAKVIDIDPVLLRSSAEAALHAAEQATNHVEAEFKDNVSGLMETLVAEGPYGYTKMWELKINSDGTLKLPITTTRDGVFEGYTELHKTMRPSTMLSLLEIRGEWYTFHEGLAGTVSKESGVEHEGLTLALFPVSPRAGITGELVWAPVPRERLGIRTSQAEVAQHDERELRRELIIRHDRYVDALRTGNVADILEGFSQDPQAAIRDYVDDTGTLINLDGEAANRGYYQGFFDKFEVLSVDILRRVAQELYLFAELRYVVHPRDGASDEVLAFHTAEFFAPGHDGRFVVRIGHETDLARLTPV